MVKRIVAGAVAALVLGAVLLVDRDIPVERLAARYAGEASRFAEVDGMHVHFRDEGTGPVLVLLHGTGASLHTWDGWAEALTDSFRVVRMDLPGFGLTGPHPTHDYTLDAYVGFLARFMDARGVERFALAGNSLGGHIAWRFALAHPERVEKLVLVDPAGARSDTPPSLAFRLARTPGVARVLAWVTPRSFIERNLREVYGDPERISPEVVDRYHALTRRAGNRDAFIARARHAEESRIDELRGLHTPTLLQWGALDRWIPVEQAEAFRAVLPHAELIVYPEAGHIPMEEIPAQTAADARAFLRR
jgi:pimeloyl-ACP methyl ester carboxylesterase